MKTAEFLHRQPIPVFVIDHADVIDPKQITAAGSLREFVAAMLSFRSPWITALFELRGILARAIGLKHEEPEDLTLQPETISFTPGAPLLFFTVVSGQEDAYIIADISDRHLDARLSIIREPFDGERARFYVVTSVRYNHWLGPLYFNLIRPFHHLIVWVSMKRAAAVIKEARLV